MRGMRKSDRDAAVRCVACPYCRAVIGAPCVRTMYSAGKGLPTITHKARVDSFFVITYGPDSEAAKQLNAGVQP